jgi:colicin import membrane protein
MTDIGRLQHYSSGGLALLVHGLFFGALMFGVSWNNPTVLPAEAELWAALPELPAPPPPEPLPPPPRPEPLPAVPPPPPVEAKPSQADIALEKAEKKKQAELKRQVLLQQEAERKEAERKEAAKQAELQRQAQEQQRLEQERIEKERAEKEKRELARRQVEEEMARQMREELDAESAQLRAYQERAKAGRQARVINDFKLRIQAKIQAYVRLPQKLVGNPEAVYQVTLLPNGEVLRAVLVKSSGQPTYDAEVERAILKASPLPLPGDKETAGVFRDGLTLKFRPTANAGGT